jgi:hypothetical protein
MRTENENEQANERNEFREKQLVERITQLLTLNDIRFRVSCFMGEGDDAVIALCDFLASQTSKIHELENRIMHLERIEEKNKGN